MANLKDLIKSAQTGFAAETGGAAEEPAGKQESAGAENSHRKEDKALPEEPARKAGKREAATGTIARGIRSMEKGSPSDRKMSVRVSEGIHKRLLLYGQADMKIQAIVSYAINHLLETKEMRDLLNRIKNDLG